MCSFGRRHDKKQFCEIIFNLDKEEMLFKYISYLELWRPFCSVERNHLCNFGRGLYEEQFFELWPVVQEEMSFIRFFIWRSGGPPVQWSKLAILKEGIMGKIHVKLYEI